MHALLIFSCSAATKHMNWNTDLTRRIVTVCMIVMVSAVLAGSASAASYQEVSVSAPDSVTHGDTVKITVDPTGGDSPYWAYGAGVEVNAYFDGDVVSGNLVILDDYQDEGSIYIDTSQFDEDATELTVLSNTLPSRSEIRVDNDVQTVSIDQENSMPAICNWWRSTGQWWYWGNCEPWAWW